MEFEGRGDGDVKKGVCRPGLIYIHIVGVFNDRVGKLLTFAPEKVKTFFIVVVCCSLGCDNCGRQ